MKRSTIRALRNFSVNRYGWNLYYGSECYDSPKFPRHVLDIEDYIQCRAGIAFSVLATQKELGKNHGGNEADSFHRASYARVMWDTIADYEKASGKPHKSLSDESRQRPRRLAPRFSSIADEIRLESQEEGGYFLPLKAPDAPAPTPDKLTPDAIEKLIAAPYEVPPRPTSNSLTICRADTPENLLAVMDECISRYASHFGQIHPNRIHLSVSNYEKFVEALDRLVTQCGNRWASPPQYLLFKGLRVYADSLIRDTEVLVTE